MKRSLSNSLKILPFVIGTLLATGCGGKSPEELIVSAEQQIAAGNENAAVVELKNALQEAPNNAKARFLLGKIYADRGAANAAVKELERALRLGYDVSSVVENIAESYYISSGAVALDELLQRSDISPKAKAIGISYSGLMALEMGQIETAESKLERAKSLGVEAHEIQILEIYLILTRGDLPTALARAKDLRQKYSNVPQVHFLLGQIHSIRGAIDDAVTAYSAYNKDRQEDARGAMFLANTLVKAKRFSEGEKIIDSLLSLTPNQPFLSFLKSLVLFDRKEFESANLAAENAIQNGFDQTSSRVLAGISAFKIGNIEQAYRNLVAVEEKLPEDSPVIKLLTFLSMELGYSLEASEYMLNKDTFSSEDIVMLSAISADLARSGKLEQTRAINTRLSTLQLTEEIELISRGIARLSLGDMTGILDVENALELNPNSSEANTILAQAYLQGGEYEKALKLAKQWRENEISLLSGIVLEGVVYNRQGKLSRAKQAFVEALAIDSSNPNANLFFSAQFEQEGNLINALDSLEAVLTKYPNHIIALERALVIANEMGEPQRGLELAKSGFEYNNKNGLDLYVKALYKIGEYEKLRSVIDSVSIGLLTDDVWILWSQTFIEAGQLEGALSVVDMWLEKQPRNPNAHLRKIALYDFSNQPYEALSQAKFAQTTLSDDRFNLLIVDFAVRTGDLILARKTFNKLSSSENESPSTLLLEAQILVSEGKLNEALTVLQSQELSGIKSERKAWLIAKAYLESGDEKNALRVYDDTILDLKTATEQTLKQYAELMIRNNNNFKAIEIYQAITERHSNDIKVLNNLAFLLSESGRSEEALEFSSKALSLNPEALYVLDTHASILWKLERMQDALLVFDKLYRLAPRNEQIVKKYASFLKANGMSEKSEKIISTL